MSAFDDAVDALYADENLAVDAVYRVGGEGSGTSIRIVFAKPKREVPFGESGALVYDIVGSVRVSDIANPKRGDTVEIVAPSGVAGTYQVEKALRDSKGLTSRLEFRIAE